MKNYNTAEEEKLGTAGIPVDLPIKGHPILSDSQNINHALTEIMRYQKLYQKQVAISYKLFRGLGVREKFYKLFFQDVAMQRKKDKVDDGYITLDILLERKTEIEEGKFKIEGTRIVGLNQVYLHS